MGQSWKLESQGHPAWYKPKLGYDKVSVLPSSDGCYTDAEMLSYTQF